MKKKYNTNKQKNHLQVLAKFLILACTFSVKCEDKVKKWLSSMPGDEKESALSSGDEEESALSSGDEYQVNIHVNVVFKFPTYASPQYSLTHTYTL